MRYIILSFAILAITTLAAFTNIKTLTVTSTAFSSNSPIPVKYTCLGQGINPPLTITDIPPEAKSLAIIVCDPDASTKIVTPVTTTQVSHKKGHKKTTVTKGARTMDACTINGYMNWIVWNVDVTDNIPEDFRTETVGVNSAGHNSYQGMCPQAGSHKYHFIVYALDTKLNIDKNTDKAGLEKVMTGHILAKGELIGEYNKTYR